MFVLEVHPFFSSSPLSKCCLHWRSGNLPSQFESLARSHFGQESILGDFGFSILRPWNGHGTGTQLSHLHVGCLKDVEWLHVEGICWYILFSYGKQQQTSTTDISPPAVMDRFCRSNVCPCQSLNSPSRINSWFEDPFLSDCYFPLGVAGSYCMLLFYGWALWDFASGIDSDGVADLCEGLRCNKTLKTLSLRLAIQKWTAGRFEISQDNRYSLIIQFCCWVSCNMMWKCLDLQYDSWW